MMSSKTKANTRCYEITMTVYADADATVPDIRSLLGDLEWTGGCYGPTDARFYCLDVADLRVKRAAPKDRAPK